MRNQISIVQIFRGLAALVVVIHHACLSTNAFVYEIPKEFAKWFNKGYLGVDLFFIISGFIIMHIHLNNLNFTYTKLSYIKKRIARIFPIYWPIGGGMIFLYFLFPSLSAVNGGREFSILSSIFLIPSNFPTALSVGWTLIHEILFYSIFIIFFYSKFYFRLSLVIWALTILFLNMQYEILGWLKYIFNLLNIEFILGVYVAEIYKNKIKFKLNSLLILVPGILITVWTLYILDYNYNPYVRLIFGFRLALVLLGLVLQKELNKNKIMLPLILLGNASFSIYLIHNPLLSITQRFAGYIGLNWYLALFFGIIISIFFGCLYHRLYEIPMLRFFHKKIRN